MSQVRCCLCGEWTDDDIDKDMSTIQCPDCVAAEVGAVPTEGARR